MAHGGVTLGKLQEALSIKYAPRPPAEIVPFRRRFRCELWRVEGGWCLRVMCGVAFVSLSWNYWINYIPWQLETGVRLGVITFKVREGDAMRCKSLIKFRPRKQETA